MEPVACGGDGEIQSSARIAKRSKGKWGVPAEVILVPAQALPRNPHNPFDHLSAEERYSRFIQLLGRIHGRLVAERDQSGQQPVLPSTPDGAT